MKIRTLLITDLCPNPSNPKGFKYLFLQLYATTVRPITIGSEGLNSFRNYTMIDNNLTQTYIFGYKTETRKADRPNLTTTKTTPNLHNLSKLV